MFSAKKLMMVSGEVSSEILVVAHAQSPTIAIFSHSGGVFMRLPNPAVLPTDAASGRSQDVAFSPDGGHMAVAHGGGGNLTIYARSGDSFVKLPDPAVLPPGEAYSLSYSPDGSFLAVAHQGIPRESSPTGWRGPYMTVYSVSGDNYTAVEPPSPHTITYTDGYGIDGNAFSVAFSPDGNHLALGHFNVSQNTSATGLMVFSRSGQGFSKISGFLPETGTVYGVAFSPDGSHLAAAHVASPYLSIFSRSGNSFTRLPDLSSMPINVCGGVSFSPDGKYLAVSARTDGLIIYSRQAGGFARLSGPSSLPSAVAGKMVFSRDGRYLFVTQEIRTFTSTNRESFNIYSISSGGVFTKVSSLDAFSSNIPFPGSTNGVSFFP